MAPTRRQRTFAGFDEDADSTALPAAAEADSARPAGASPGGSPPESLADRTVYVVDAHSLIYQVFHALPEMSGPQGQPVGAIHGFLRDMLDILERQQPDFLFCAFDAPGKTFRHAAFAAYKANREEMPADLQPQIPAIKRLMAALGIPCLECARYEADDILATLARETASRGGTCCLVTADKDCRQLIRDTVSIYNIRKDELFGVESLCEQWGIRPEQVVDFQALVGDSVDNVPGVPLIGPKIARSLLAQYGTLEAVLEHAADVAGKKRSENLVQYRDQALLSRQLVRLHDRVPVPLDWQQARVGELPVDAALEMCREFGFRSLAERLSALAGGRPAAEWKANYVTVTTLPALRQLAARMLEQPRVACDTETTSTSPRFAELVGLSFAWQEGQAYYVPLRAPAGQPQLDPEQALQLLRPVLESPAVGKVGQNLKYDLVVLRNRDVRMQGLGFDTMVADYLLDPGQRNHSLDDLARRYLDHETIKIHDLIGSGRQQKRMDEVDVDRVAEYAAEDADVTWRLAEMLEPQLCEAGLAGLFAELEMPLVEVLAEMEFHGIHVDVNRLRGLGDRFGRRMQQLESEIYELAGGPFNVDSRRQLSEVLFDRLQLPVIKKTKTGPSTDAEVLAELAPLHPLPAKVLEYRQHAKLKSTYVDALPVLVHPETGRIHTSFKQDVAATGRLSSTEPNLQNIPVRTPAGREIRSAFVPHPASWQLVTADYSQIELRVLAHFSGDAALQQAFAEERDIHRQVASEVYGVPPEEVTPAMRRRAKAINFGVIYGQSPFGLAKALGIAQEEAATFIDAYFARYVGVVAFMEKVLEQCRQNGYVSTILGRRRAVHGVRDPARISNSRQRNLPERIAINTVIQGSAADLIKQAMINVYRRLRRESLEARMLLQIHDELVFEAPPEELPSLAALVTEEMTAACRLQVPLKVDVKAGRNWAECEEVT